MSIPMDGATIGFLGIAISLAVKVSPIQCDALYEFSFPIKAPKCELVSVRAKRPVLYPVELQAHLFASVLAGSLPNYKFANASIVYWILAFASMTTVRK